MKAKTIYVCQTCGYKNAKWLGKCPECNEYNSLVEEAIRPEEGRHLRPIISEDAPISICDVKPQEHSRIVVGIGEMDRVLGGGIVFGSVSLIGGDPGIGKSTLILQISQKIAEQGNKVLYISAEESTMQTKLRADRLGVNSPNLFIVSETNLDVIKRHIEAVQPAFAVIDSIQMIYRPDLPSAPGTVGQVRECATELVFMAKRRGISLFIIGHVTKDGSIAGPRTLEHLVDGVFYCEGDRFQVYRILRAVKNRFGSTNEIGIFEMASSGLVEVPNPSQLFLSTDRRNLVGSVVTPAIIGSRTLLVEIQALTSRTNIGIPARRVTGVELNRVAMILAVLESKCGLHMGMQDVFVNAVGGVQIEEPAADLAIAAAIASSYKGKGVDANVLAVGEVGLAGEVRAVSQGALRVNEGKRLGFEKFVVPRDNLKGIDGVADVAGISSLKDALEAMSVL